MGIFSSIFAMVNSGFLTMMTVRENEDKPAIVKKRNVVRIFHFALAFGLSKLYFIRFYLFTLFSQRSWNHVRDLDSQSAIV